MATDTKTILIKKYANRRLYHTGTSSYVTLDDLSEMVHKGEDFVVSDAKTSEDITRSVLTQIIFDQENKVGQGGNLLPTTFLRQLIRFYGDSMQALVPKYLEFSIDRLTSDQQKFRDHLKSAFGLPVLTNSNSADPDSVNSASTGLNPASPLPSFPKTVFAAPATFKMIEEQARANMAIFSEALTLFSPFKAKKPVNIEPEQSKSDPEVNDLEIVKQQLAHLQLRLDQMDKKS